MPFYKYEALKRDGSRLHASTFATSLPDLEESLRTRELVLVEAEEIRQKPGSKGLITQFIAEFAPLIQSGISIDRALAIIGEDSQDKKLSNLAMTLYGTIKGGGSLSQAMQETGLFESYATALIQAGEVSGQLAKVLRTLEEHYMLRSKLRSEVTSALAYPAILFAVCILSLIAISYKVIPKFEEMFMDRETMLPVHTRIVFAVSNFLKDYSLVVILLLSVAILISLVLYRRSETVKFRFDGLALRMPGLRAYTRQLQGTNFSTMLGVLLQSGVPMLQALELSKNVYTLAPLRQGAEATINDVRRGVALHEAVDHIPYFPRMTTRFIRVGQETGNMGEMIAKAGDILSLRLQTRLKRFSATLGPMIILVMGTMIGMVVWSMLSAVYSFSDAL